MKAPLSAMVTCCLLLGSLCSAEDRLLTSFESEEETRAWSGGEVVSQNATAGTHAYRVMPDTTAEAKLQGDWSGERLLKLDVWNPGDVVLVNFRFLDAQERSIMAFEYNVYSGRSTQHIRVDGLANNFGIAAGIDTAHMARMQVIVSKRWKLDTCSEGLTIDNLRLSTGPTEPYQELPDGKPATDPPLAKPAGFLLPEFPGFEAGYHTFAVDPAGYQILSRPATGHDGKGRALEFKPLAVDTIRIWDGERTFPQEGTYVMEFWAKGPAGALFVDHSGQQSFPLTPAWKKYSYEFTMSAGTTRRFVLEVQNLQGQSAWLDDLLVYLKGATKDLEPVSQAKGGPKVVTYADGIVYVNGKPALILGFLRGDPEKLRGTPFNLCGPQELLQPTMEFLDKCAECNLLTGVNLTATLRAVAPDNVTYFAEKYKNHPALFSYYLCDEPNHASPSACSEAPVMARATQLLRQADPNHLTQTIVIPWCASAVYRFRDTVDILGGDTYVVRGTKDNSELWGVYNSCEAFRQSATEGQPFIFTPTTAPARITREENRITREENWAQAYMCFAAGAAGIMWFEFDGAQAKWDDFVELGKELRSIEPLLVGVALEKGLTFENDVLPEFVSGRTTHKDFKQIRGIGRASDTQTALITVNLTPVPAEKVKMTAPFLAHATEATVLFENRTVPVNGGVIVDSFRGLERHVYVVPGVPEGVKPRPAPQVGGPHVTDAGAAWRLESAGPTKGRSAEDVERERFIEAETKKADELLAKGDTEGARRVLQGILDRYPEAQQIRERIRSLR